MSDEWFDYYILTKSYRFDDDAEIVLLNQNDPARVLRYIAKFGLCYRAKDYVLKMKMLEYCRALLCRKDYFHGRDLQNFITFAEEEDIFNNMRLLPHYNSKEDQNLSFSCLTDSKLIIQALAICLLSAENKEKIMQRNIFDEMKAMICSNSYSKDYDQFIFQSSDIEMLKVWLYRQDKKNPLSSFVDFSSLTKEAVRFLIDNCDFSPELEKQFYEACFQPEIEYYL